MFTHGEGVLKVDLDMAQKKMCVLQRVSNLQLLFYFRIVDEFNNMIQGNQKLEV